MLAVVLALGLAPPGRAAGTELRVRTPESLPKAGETFTLSVEIAGNPGVAAVQFTIPFDRDVMTCSSVEVGTVLQGSLSATNPNARAGAKIAAASATALEGDGQLGVFTFTAKRDLTAADFRIRDVIINNGENKHVTYTVIGATEEKTAPPPTQTPPTETTGGTQTPTGGDSIAKPEDSTGQSGTGQKPTETAKPEESAGTQTPVKSRFTDMANHWAAADAEKAAELGIINGYEDGTFKPDNNLTRAQFVTILYRQAGRPAVTGTTPFTDIAGINEEFQTAICWAYEKKLVDGTTPTTFNPQGTLSHQATMKILFQHNGGTVGGEQMFYSVYDGSFPDSGKLADWARAPMYWGVYNTLIDAGEGQPLNPAQPTTRGQLARTMVRYMEKFGEEENA